MNPMACVARAPRRVDRFVAVVVESIRERDAEARGEADGGGTA